MPHFLARSRPVVRFLSENGESNWSTGFFQAKASRTIDPGRSSVLPIAPSIVSELSRRFPTIPCSCSWSGYETLLRLGPFTRRSSSGSIDDRSILLPHLASLLYLRWQWLCCPWLTYWCSQCRLEIIGDIL